MMKVHRRAGKALMLLAFFWLLPAAASSAAELKLETLLQEALKNSPEILASGARAEAARHRIPQAGSLPDPMFMVGYQNEGWQKYNYGESPDAQWMFSLSQMFLFPGKRPLKEEMARQDAEAAAVMHESAKLKVLSKTKEIFYDLILAHKSIDLIREKQALFAKLEEAALARYAAGLGMQQDALMAQTEKYMLLEKEEMQKQKIRSLEAMLIATLGRDIREPLGRPVEPVAVRPSFTIDEMIAKAYEHSPEIRVKKRMIAAAEARVKMAEKEFYPDVTVTAGYAARGGQYADMWSLQTTVNLPIFSRTKQKEALFEAKALLAEATRELQAAELMTASALRDAYAMYTASGRLMEIYRSGLMPRAAQDFDSALAGYGNGKAEAVSVIGRLKALIDYEGLYLAQAAEHDKAAVRFELMTGMADRGGTVQ